MTEYATPYEILGIAPGDVIHFNDLGEVIAFENDIAHAIRPDMTRDQWDAWDARMRLTNELAVPKFHGRLLDITLTAVVSPYERYIDASERGWSFRQGIVARERKAAVNLPTLEHFIGFVFMAHAKSTGKPIIGTVDTELYYFPTSQHLNSSGTPKASTQKAGGRSVMRAVTKPKLNKNSFIEHDENAKRIGFEILRNQMKRARSQPIRN